MPDPVGLPASLPVIAVLATGGTIAGAQPDPLSTGYVAGTLTVDQLTAAVPLLSTVAQVRSEQIANVGSQNMTHPIWHALAHRVQALMQDDTVDGIAITHGTDTLEETAYFLSLVVSGDKPVVLLGAMRPATALGADGPANLFSAVALAAHAQARGRGPLVVMNGDIHYAREVQKMAAGGLCPFASPNRGRAGFIHGREPLFYPSSAVPRPAKAVFPIDALGPAGQWPRVGIVHAHADMQADVIDFMAGHYAGLVLAGVGDGNATETAMRALRGAAARGVAIVRTTRTGSGYVARNVELDDNAHRFVAAGDLSPQKARVLLMLALAVTRDSIDLQRTFDHC